MGRVISLTRVHLQVLIRDFIQYISTEGEACCSVDDDAGVAHVHGCLHHHHLIYLLTRARA